MGLEIKTDLQDVNWEQLAVVYSLAFNGQQTGEMVKTIFSRSYFTRIAVYDGRFVGGVYAFSDGLLDASVHGLAVHPDFRKQGIGRALMKSLVDGIPSNIALLLTAEESLQDYYRSFGFRKLKTAMARGFPPQDMEP